MSVAPINWMAVIVAMIISMVLGFVWYSMPLFGKPWMKAVGLKEEDIKKGPGSGYAVAIISSLVSAYVLAHFVSYTGATTAGAGAITGFWAWLGFVAAPMAMNAVFEQRSSTLFWINTGMQLVNLMVLGALLAVWR